MCTIVEMIKKRSFTLMCTWQNLTLGLKETSTPPKKRKTKECGNKEKRKSGEKTRRKNRKAKKIFRTLKIASELSTILGY